MKIKKVLSLVLVFMLLLSTTSAFAAVPEGTIVFGNVAYDLQALADDSFTSEILGNYRDNNNDFAYKKIGGDWVNSLNNETTPELPATITLKKGDGTTEIITVEEPTGELKVVGVSAIDANTISVTFDNEETVEIELEEALVHGQTEVTFVYEEVEYTAELTEAWVDEAVVIEEAAEEAVAAYEAATITTFDNVAVAAELKETAEAAVALVEDEEVVEALEARIADQEEALQEIVDAKLEAVNKAANQVTLLSALEDFFNNVDESLIADYRTVLGTGNAQDSVAEVQAEINRINVVGEVNDAETQVQLLRALNKGQELGVFEGVREDYIVTYADAILPAGVLTAQQIQDVIDGAADAVVNTATLAVEAAEAAPTNDALIETAEEEVAKVPADLVNEDEESYRELLEARVADVKVVNDVLAAEAVSSVRLLNSLKANEFENIVDDSIDQYKVRISGLSGAVTVEDIQDEIDAENLLAAQTAVTAAETAPLTAAKVATAQVLVNYLPEDVAPATTKADLQDRLDVVTALIAVADATTEAGLYDALVAYANMLDDDGALLEDIDEANKAYYFEAKEDDNTLTPEGIVGAGNTAAEAYEEAIDARITFGRGAIYNYGARYAVDYYVNVTDKVESVKVELYKGDTLLGGATGTPKLITHVNEGTTLSTPFGISTPFEILDNENTFDYVADGYWTYSGWQGGIFDKADTVKIEVSFADGETANIEIRFDETDDEDYPISVVIEEEINGAIANDIVKTIAKSEDVAEVEGLLVDLANAGQLSSFLEIAAADRTFVAEEIVAEEAATKEAWTAETLNTYIGTVNTDTIEAAKTAVNALTNKSNEAAVITALRNVTVFDDLGLIAQKDVANAFIEEVLEGLEDGKTPNFKSYTELSNFVEGLI